MRRSPRTGRSRSLADPFVPDKGHPRLVTVAVDQITDSIETATIEAAVTQASLRADWTEPETVESRTP